MHRPRAIFVFGAMPRSPRLFHGEHANRREPRRQALKNRMHHKARRPAAIGIWPVAIKTVFSDIEITGGKIEGGESLWGIAKEHYGDAMKYPAIFEANKPMLEDPDFPRVPPSPTS